jgi:hypothetical protein
MAIGGLLATLVCAAPAFAEQVKGGRPAAEGSWPSIVGLTSAELLPDTYLAQFCGGTVIAPQWVLTAAHCLEVDDIWTLAGTHTLGDGSGALTRVAARRVHPGWDENTLFFDVALLQLAEPVTAPPMPLAGPSLAARWRPGQPAQFAGWGNTRNELGPKPKLLQEADAPMLDDSESGCPGLEAAAVCAGAPERDINACNGDSGGPLTVRDAQGRAFLVGVASSVFPGCRLFGTRFMSVSAVRDFIDETIGWTRALTADELTVGDQRTVTLRASGTAPVVIDRVTLTGGEIVADECSQTALAIGGACAVTAHLTGDGRLTIASDVPGGETTVPLALPAPVAGPDTTVTPPPAGDAPPPAALPRPKVSIRLASGRRLTLRLDGAGSVEVTLTLRRGKRTVRVATARATFTRAGRQTVRLRLTSAGRRLLRTTPKLRVTARVRAQAAGGTTTTSARFTLR